MKDHKFCAFVSTSHNGISGVSCDCPWQATLESALSDGVETATYYVLECGYEVWLTMRRVCVRCQRRGSITFGKRIVRSKPCPDCKGVGEEVVIPEFSIRVHKNAVDRHTTV